MASNSEILAIKVLEMNFKKEMINKDFEAFKRTHPTLLRCILAAMDEFNQIEIETNFGSGDNKDKWWYEYAYPTTPKK